VINHVEYFDRTIFASDDSGSVVMYDIGEEGVKDEFDGHPRYVLFSRVAACTSRDGKHKMNYLLTACYDGKVRVRCLPATLARYNNTNQLS
jgi:hypothetical protein